MSGDSDVIRASRVMDFISGEGRGDNSGDNSGGNTGGNTGDSTGNNAGNSRARGEPFVSSPQRPICSRRRPYIPAAVLATWFRLLIFGLPDITVHGMWQRR